MTTGRDIAKFMTQLTGENYVELYDEAEKNDEQLKTEAQNKFKNLIERINKVSENNKRELID